MNNVLSSVFKQTMARERKTITIWETGEQFDCFFRKNNDGTNQRDTMIMFYSVDAPIKEGTILTYGDSRFLVLNQETAENDIYYKSAVIRTNGVINTHSLSVVGLPIYGDSINNATTTTNTNFNLIDGNVELLAEDCGLAKKLEIDDTFNEFGRTWKITNLFYIDGICHIIAEITADSTPTYDYKLVLSDLTEINVKPGDTAQTQAKAYCNEIEITNANISYTSSNVDIATIDENGNISYMADGEVYFTATWESQNINKTTQTVTVASVVADDKVSIFVQPIDEICYDFPETLQYYACRGGVRDDTIPVSFKIENISVNNNYNTYAKKITLTDNGDNTIELSVNGSVMLGKTFDLVACNEEYGVENRQKIKVVSMF